MYRLAGGRLTIIDLSMIIVFFVTFETFLSLFFIPNEVRDKKKA